jgi:hypothetical protein
MRLRDKARATGAGPFWNPTPEQEKLERELYSSSRPAVAYGGDRQLDYASQQAQQKPFKDWKNNGRWAPKYNPPVLPGRRIFHTTAAPKRLNWKQKVVYEGRIIGSVSRKILARQLGVDENEVARIERQVRRRMSKIPKGQ